MKKIAAFTMLVATLVAVSPVAAQPRQPIGERISLVGGDVDFSAGQPFHVSQGWHHPIKTLRAHGGAAPAPIGRFDFELEVDGEVRDEDFVMRYVDHEAEELRNKWVHNLPDGMTGEHSFTGHWFAPCYWAKELNPDLECTRPNEKVEIASSTVVVTFVSEE